MTKPSETLLAWTSGDRICSYLSCKISFSAVSCIFNKHIERKSRERAKHQQTHSLTSQSRHLHRFGAPNLLSPPPFLGTQALTISRLQIILHSAYDTYLNGTNGYKWHCSPTTTVQVNATDDSSKCSS